MFAFQRSKLVRLASSCRSSSGTQVRWYYAKLASLDPLNPKMSLLRKTKIVCTIGPSTWDDEGIKSLLGAGMNVLRINCSHGDHEMYERVITSVRKHVLEVEPHGWMVGEKTNVRCGIALDTKGPEIRLGEFPATMKSVEIKKGSSVVLHTNSKFSKVQDAGNLFVDYPNITKCIGVGSKIFIDDGSLSLTAKVMENEKITCMVDNTAVISSRKGVNLPNAVLDLPAVSAKDKLDLAFARKIGVDFIFASFVRKAEHVEEIRELVGPEIKIIAKLENAEGLKNIDGILEAADGIMVARGDLGIEIPQEHVFLAQKMLISKANLIGKPVICATQMLESMTRSPRPTRAEASDVANAVMDGADAVMLSGETANGQYPVEAVQTMGELCKTAEYCLDYKAKTEQIRNATSEVAKPICEALVVSGVVAAMEEGAKLILVHSETGDSPRICAKYKPKATVLCLTSNPRIARQLQLSHGIRVFVVPKGVDSREAATMGIKVALSDKIVRPGDRVVAISSQLSSMRLLEVPEWIERL